MEHEPLATASLSDLVSWAAQARRVVAAIDDDNDVARIAGYADELDAEIQRRRQETP